MSQRSAHLNPSAPYPMSTAFPPAAKRHPRGKKGALHANACGGPWGAALDLMPPPPATSGARRSALGLGAVAQTRDATRLVEQERAARALVAILPFDAAPWLLSSRPETVAAEPPNEVAERLVDRLKGHNPGSLHSAASALGRLLTWIRVNRPSATEVEGIHYSDWVAATQPSSSTIDGLTWLRDHTGLITHARSAIGNGARRLPAGTSLAKEPLRPFILFGLETLAASHPSEFVRGHAAAWATMAKCLLRVEQATSCAINAVTEVHAGTSSAHVIFGSLLREKHPDQRKQSPKPFMGIASSAAHGLRVYDALTAMLEGREDVRSLILDTDSPSGDPDSATTWVSAPLAPGRRADASLHALLRMAPIFAPNPEDYHGHSPKRFIPRVAEASPSLSSTDANELGRFTGSTAKDGDLTPTAAMLARHTTRCAALPAVYAGKEKVTTVARLFVRVHELLRTAQRAGAGGADLATFDVFREIP